MIAPSPILLFDGVCNLCNRLVIFIIRRDKKNRIRFAPLQSPVGKSFLEKHNITGEDINSIVYIEGDNYLLKSSAILHLLKILGGGWNLIYGLIIIPKFFRDFLYDIIARNRYWFFGKSDSCMISSPGFVDRFLS
jgi:predicted DCC family thiol-disulfide oxidoreductase YuxK